MSILLVTFGLALGGALLLWFVVFPLVGWFFKETGRAAGFKDED